jgi:hypothetical protein
MLQLLPLEEWERCEGAAQREQLEASVGKFRARAKQVAHAIRRRITFAANPLLCRISPPTSEHMAHAAQRLD